MLPIAMGVGGAMAVGGLAGSYLSGAMDRGRQPDQAAYQYGYDPRYDWQQAQADYARQQQVAGGLMSAADLAGAEARGQAGPSVSEQQLRQGQAQAAAAGFNMAASARGGAGAQMMAQRQAQRAAADQALAVNRDAGILRAQERQAAQARELQALSQAGGLASSMRGGSQAQSQAEVQAQMEAARYKQQGAMAYDQAAVGASEAERQRKAAMWGGITKAGGSMMSLGMGG